MAVLSSVAIPEISRCRIVEKIHSGPVADLYRARQAPLDRLVLVKALHSTILPSSPFAALLEREARILMELSHSNLLALYEFGRTEETSWLVLEHVDGPTVADVLGRVGRLAPPVALSIAIELARALEHAHSRDVVHRSLQPKNVVLSKQGPVKLIEFGVASDERMPTAPELLEGGTSFVAPSYLSPEQILGEPADPRSDLFSLGVVLYEMLAGARPFDGPDERTTTQRIRHDAPAPLTRAGFEVPPSVERFLRRALEKLPADRFADASECARALEACLADCGGGSPPSLIARALFDAGFSITEPAALGDREVAASPSHFSLGPTLMGIALSGLLLVVGVAAIELLLGGDHAERGRRIGGRLELAPPRPALLRVVATPWAHVVVDGQRVDTTPFARAIPLRPGKHYVRLEHPNAPPERRELDVGPDQVVLLDVAMQVARPPEPLPAASAPPATSSP